MFILRLSVTMLLSSAGRQTMLQQGTRSRVTLGWSGGSTASSRAEAESGSNFLWLCHCCHSMCDSSPLSLETPGLASPVCL